MIFEYVEPGELIEKIARWLNTDGKLIIILQLPSEKSQKVSKTAYESLRELEPILNLVEPEVVQQKCSEASLVEMWSFTRVLESTKEFFVGHFSKQNG